MRLYNAAESLRRKWLKIAVAVNMRRRNFYFPFLKQNRRKNKSFTDRQGRGMGREGGRRKGRGVSHSSLWEEVVNPGRALVML